MNYTKLISDVLTTLGHARSEEEIQKIERGEDKELSCMPVYAAIDPVCEQLFKTPFLFTLGARSAAIHDHTPLRPFINLEPPHPSGDEVVWDYMPWLSIDFAALCSGDEQKIRGAISFVDDRRLIRENDFDCEPGIGPFHRSPDEQNVWLVPETEQDRILRLIGDEDDNAGTEIGWAVVRFVSSLLVAFIRLGFVPQPYSWYEQHSEESLTDDLLEACK